MISERNASALVTRDESYASETFTNKQLATRAEDAKRRAEQAAKGEEVESDTEAQEDMKEEAAKAAAKAKREEEAKAFETPAASGAVVGGPSEEAVCVVIAIGVNPKKSGAAGEGAAAPEPAAPETVKKRIKQVAWHHKGDYLATVSADGSSSAVLIHRLTKAQSQSPFTKSKGVVSCVSFHPSKPLLFVCSQRHIRVYNLATQQLVKKLMSGLSVLTSSILFVPSRACLYLCVLSCSLAHNVLDWMDAQVRSG